MWLLIFFSKFNFFLKLKNFGYKMSGVCQIQNHIFRPTSSFLPCKIFFLPSILFLLNRNHHHPFLVPQHLHSHHHLPPLISPSFDSHHHPCPSRLSPPPSLGLSWSDSSTISRLHLDQSPSPLFSALSDRSSSTTIPFFFSSKRSAPA